jgi:hypothetical protein
MQRLAVMLVLVAVSATVCGAGSSRTSPRKGRGTTYASKRYGYQIVLTGPYTMTPAYGQWDGDFPFGSSGKVDLIVDPHDRKFIIAAKPVSPGMSLSRWEAFVAGVKRESCSTLRRFRTSSLGAAPAREFLDTCPGYNVITLAAVHERRGYLFEYLAPPSFSAASDRRTYEAGRRAFSFTD